MTRLLLLLGLVAASASAIQAAVSNTVVLYVGTYTRDEGWVDGKGKGVYSFLFDTNAGSLKQLSVATDAGTNPSFVSGTPYTGSPQGQYIYAVNEVSDASSKTGTTGYVVAMGMRSNGSIYKLNQQASEGGAPAHVSVSPDRKFVLVSNYNGGSIALFPVQADGSLAPASDVHAYNQSVSHLHSTLWLPGSKYVFAADLGTDRVLVFRINMKAKTLVPVTSATVTTTSGSGPRQMAIDQQQKFLYVINQLSCTIAVYTLDATKSNPIASKPVQVVSTLPAGFDTVKTPSSAAAIQLSSDGKFVFASTRGANIITVYRIASGKLTVVGFESTRGTTPRSLLAFRSFVLAANQDSSSIVAFAFNDKAGNITYVNTTACPTPVSLFVAQTS